MHTPWTRLGAVDRFVRLHFFGFTALLLLLGAASVTPDPPLGRLILLLGVGLCFHDFAYVFNDVIDLPVDRTHPDRQLDYLVRGVITPRQALVFCFLHIPLGMGLALWAGAGADALICLALGFVLMTVYDLWGKKCPIPPLTDLAQGIAWGSLAVFAALTLAAHVNALTWVAALHGAMFIFLINGVHGGLRDLDNDLARGRSTTASYLGARPVREQVPLSRSLRWFAMSIQLGLSVVHLSPILTGDLVLTPFALWALTVALLVLEGMCIHFMLRVFAVHDPRWGQDFRVHLGLLQVPPMLLFSAHMSAWLTLLVFLTMAWALLFLPVTREVVARTLARLPGMARRMHHG